MNENLIHIVYLTTNLVNDKQYIGVHSTNDLSDDYLGSGHLLKKAISKYGSKSFIRETIKICKTRDEALDIESYIVDEDFVSLENTYNIALGGKGARPGKDHFFYGKTISDLGKKSISKANKRDFRNGKRKPPSSLIWLGRSHKKSSIIKMKNTLKKINHQVGSKNSQFGTCWITKDGKNKKIKKEDLDVFLTKGWNKGRKL